MIPDGTTVVIPRCQPGAPAASNKKGPPSPTADNVARKELLLILTPHIYRPGKQDSSKAELPRVVEAPVAHPLPPANPSLNSVQFSDANVRKVLEMLARQAHTNIVITSGVAGKVTMDIRDKSFDELLAIIAKVCDLAVRREGDVIYISTPAEIRKAQEDNLPVRVYHLNFVKSSDVIKMIFPLRSPKGKITPSPDAATGMSDKSSGGIGTVIVVQDYEDVLKIVDGVIAKIDVKPRKP